MFEFGVDGWGETKCGQGGADGCGVADWPGEAKFGGDCPDCCEEAKFDGWVETKCG